jgi:DNA-3-methyladenine glycosylase II
VRVIGPPRLRPSLGEPFADLVRAIIFQQLAGRAAAAIYARLADRLPEGITAHSILGIPIEALRAAGLSAAKAASIRELATSVVEGALELESLASLADEEVVASLSRVRGIGRWTAEMFLIFSLRRLDVWPVGDHGVRRGYAIIHGLSSPPRPRELLGLGERYRPYRTALAWYCWRATETVLPTE